MTGELSAPPHHGKLRDTITLPLGSRSLRKLTIEEIINPKQCVNETIQNRLTGLKLVFKKYISINITDKLQVRVGPCLGYFVPCVHSYQKIALAHPPHIHTRKTSKRWWEKSRENIAKASAKYLLLVLQACASLIVQATGGESGQLTCHAPVTFRSVELDFLVGTENPIRLLYFAAPLTLDKTKQGVPRLRERVLSAFLAFFGAMLRN